jgi:hypothetical protein
MGWTVLHHPVHSPDLALSDYYLFGPVKMHCVNTILCKLKQSFHVMCFEAEAGNFTTLVYRILINVGKSLLKMTETLWKNSLIIAKDE